MERAEAIKIIKTATVYTPEEMEALETLIPELNDSEESKEERVRKDIIGLIKFALNDGSAVSPGSHTTKEEALAYLEKQKEQPQEELVYRLNGLMQEYVKEGKDEAEKEHRFKCYHLFWDALEDADFFEQKEQKPKPYWHKIKAYEQLPCKAYIYKFAYEQENNFHGKATIKGYLVPNDPVKIGCDTWYLPVEDIKNLPKEDELNTTNLTKTVEQQSAEWSEDWREEDIQTRFAFYTYKDEDGVLYLSNVFVEETSRNHGFGTKILIAAEKVAETIGATTISLKVKQDSPANAWYRKNGYGYVAFEDGYDWLEKNLEYMKPNKQEWSEEDEKVIDTIVSVLGQYVDYKAVSGTGSGYATPRYSKEIDWLKSLRPQSKIHYWTEEEIEPIISDYLTGREHYGGMMSRLRCLKPKSHWKPSVEQMNTLLSVEGILRSLQYDDKAKILASIYEQLKKLM